MTNKLTDCLVFYAHQSVIRELDNTVIALLMLIIVGLFVWRFTRRDK